jgi:excisionase family DNA binding protein
MTEFQSLPARVRAVLNDPFVSLTVAQRMLGFSRSSMNRFIRAGNLRVHRVGLRGHRRVRLSDVEQLLANSEVNQ